MAAVDTVASDHYRRQGALIDATVRRALTLWRRMDARDPFTSWDAIAAEMLQSLTAAQELAAAAGTGYVSAALAAQGVTATPSGWLSPGALSGIASDGRSLAGLLVGAPLTVRGQLAAGASPSAALLSGWANLAMHLDMQIADAGRAADQVALVATPQAKTWVRMIQAGACSRCAVLAGRVYRWNADFLRHPRCHCRAIPAAEATTDDLTTDPHAYFDSLTSSEQDRIFTKAGAEAIRHGADISQVVNARRGMSTAVPKGARDSWGRGRLVAEQVHGRPAFTTREGVTRRGVAGQSQLIVRNGGVRLMPEQIFRDATSREDAVRLLHLHGYLAA